jgi:GNAT superfamily N-acetyltransferase
MQLHDIADGLTLCRYAGWNQLGRDWEIFLQLSPYDCLVATQEEKIIGTLTTIRYQKFFSWIGMVLVDPAYQRQGIGIQLLKKALQILQQEETIKLDATFAGREVYLKLNFVDGYRLSRMVINSCEKKSEVRAARSLHKTDMTELAEFDLKIFGADRRVLLEWTLEGAPEYAFIIKEKNEIHGYCLGREGYIFTHIGPVIAKNLSVAKDLVLAVLNNNIGRAVIVDVLHFDPGWINWLTSMGFAEQRSFIRMYRGSNRFPGMPEKQFAILGPEFG